MLDFKIIESLDTNVILRAILTDQEEQGEKARQLLSRKNRRYQVSAMAISECIYVLTRTLGHSRENAVRWMRSFLCGDNIAYDREFHDAVFEMFLKHKSLSYGDCYLAIEVETTGAEPLWTFDQALAKKSPVAKLVA